MVLTFLFCFFYMFVYSFSIMLQFDVITKERNSQTVHVLFALLVLTILLNSVNYYDFYLLLKINMKTPLCRLIFCIYFILLPSCK